MNVSKCQACQLPKGTTRGSKVLYKCTKCYRRCHASCMQRSAKPTGPCSYTCKFCVEAGPVMKDSSALKVAANQRLTRSVAAPSPPCARESSDSLAGHSNLTSRLPLGASTPAQTGVRRVAIPQAPRNSQQEDPMDATGSRSNSDFTRTNNTSCTPDTGTSSVISFDSSNNQCKLNIEGINSSYKNFTESVKQVAAIKSRFDDILIHLRLIPALDEELRKVKSDLLEVSEKYNSLHSQLEECKTRNNALANENKCLKTKIDEIENKLLVVPSRAADSCEHNTKQTNVKSKNSHSNTIKHTASTNTDNNNYTRTNKQHSAHKQHKKHPQRAGTAASPRGSRVAEASMLMLSGFVDCVKAGLEPEGLAYVVLSTILPSLNREDIISARELRTSLSSREPRSSAGEEPATPHSTPVDALSSDARVGSSKSSRLPSLLVQLSGPDLVRNVLAAKHTFTAFNVADLDLTRLSKGVSKHLSHVPIFVNEYLCHDVYKDFISLKTLAKNLGFKFVWHKRGRFFTRFREGDQVSLFNNAADLHAIRAGCQNRVPNSELSDAAQPAKKD